VTLTLLGSVSRHNPSSSSRTHRHGDGNRCTRGSRRLTHTAADPEAGRQTSLLSGSASHTAGALGALRRHKLQYSFDVFLIRFSPSFVCSLYASKHRGLKIV